MAISLIHSPQIQETNSNWIFKIERNFALAFKNRIHNWATGKNSADGFLNLRLYTQIYQEFQKQEFGSLFGSYSEFYDAIKFNSIVFDPSRSCLLVSFRI